MNRSILISAATLSLVALTLCTTFVCNAVDRAAGKLIEEQRVIELEGARSARLSLKSGNANIDLRAGTQKLMDGRFAYSLADWKPLMNLEKKRGAVQLTLNQPPQKSMSFIKNARNEWDLALNGSVPLDLGVKSASGNLGFDLSKLCVTKLDAETASGDVAVDLSGDHKQLSSFKARSASGGIAVTLTGLYRSLSTADLASASGDVTVDLTGEWASDAAIRIKTASGDATVKLPAKAGVRVTAKTLSGKVNAPGLAAVDGALVNSAYGHTKPTLNISVESYSGEIKLSVAE